MLIQLKDLTKFIVTSPTKNNFIRLIIFFFVLRAGLKKSKQDQSVFRMYEFSLKVRSNRHL